MAKRYDYLIIGGGMSAAAAVEGIREVDKDGSIGIISIENQRPYDRPPLTKKLWMGKPESMIWRELPEENLDLMLNCRVTGLEPDQKQVQDAEGNTYHYKKLLLATGGKPQRLSFTPEETLYFRTLRDYHKIREWTGKGARFGVIGGGFIGSEIAAALAMNGEKVVMVFPESGIGERIYPKDLSQYLNQYYEQKGVEVRAGMGVSAVEQKNGKFFMKAEDGQSVEVDHIIAGIGIRPNTELAESAGIAIESRENGGGIHVDEYLRTNQPDIYAAGDVASFYNPALGRQMRVEHEDNANVMGRTAGLNMAGQETPYRHQPFFYSDLFELGYEAVGELDSRLETFADWKEPFRKGVVYYRKDGKVRGVLLWDTWDQVEAARELISGGKEYTKKELAGLLPKEG